MGGRAVVAGGMGKGDRLLQLATGRTLKTVFSDSGFILTAKPPCLTPGSIPPAEAGEEARVEIGVFVETEVREVRKSWTLGCADIEDTPGRKHFKHLLGSKNDFKGK